VQTGETQGGRLLVELAQVDDGVVAREDAEGGARRGVLGVRPVAVGVRSEEEQVGAGRGEVEGQVEIAGASRTRGTQGQAGVAGGQRCVRDRRGGAEPPGIGGQSEVEDCEGGAYIRRVQDDDLPPIAIPVPMLVQARCSV
jgi:hypothetical protein